jgi:GNAT superfamily N-acetyltransferase
MGQDVGVGEVPEVRRARIDEAERIATIFLRSRHASVPDIPPLVHLDEDVYVYFATVVLPNREVWVGDADGEAVAVLVLDDDWIEHLYADPEWTGRGLGSKLVDLAKAQRRNGLNLWTFQSNVKARRFYERHGFIAEEMTEGDNEEGAPDVRYRWTPPPAEGGADRDNQLLS